MEWVRLANERRLAYVGKVRIRHITREAQRLRTREGAERDLPLSMSSCKRTGGQLKTLATKLKESLEPLSDCARRVNISSKLAQGCHSWSACIWEIENSIGGACSTSPDWTPYQERVRYNENANDFCNWALFQHLDVREICHYFATFGYISFRLQGLKLIHLSRTSTKIDLHYMTCLNRSIR